MSLLHDYLFYNSGNEAPDNYHLGSLWVAVASVAGRKVWFDYGYQRIHPHIYCVLVGPAGNRKSAAMFRGKSLMREVGGVNFAAQLESSQGLIKQMAESEMVFQYNGLPQAFCGLTVCVGELKDFIGVSMNTMINFATAVWDQDTYDYKLRNKEDLVITNPSLNILACDTPEWITTSLRGDIISGGFSRRVLWIYEGARKKRIAFPVVTPEQRAAWDRCVAHLKQVQELVGEFVMDEEAKERFAHWYENEVLLEIPKNNTALLGYYDTKHVLVLKLCMITAMCQDLKLVITRPILETVLELLRNIEQKLPNVFQGMGRNDLNIVTSKALQLLEMHKIPMKRKDLEAALWNDAKGWEIEEVMAHLERSKLIETWVQGPPENQRPMVCLPEHVPAAVRAALERRRAEAQGASEQSAQPTATDSARDDLEFLLRANQQKPPTSS